MYVVLILIILALIFDLACCIIASRKERKVFLYIKENEKYKGPF